jgi:pimeloyl-ACP methyl ester carboxylesterase
MSTTGDMARKQSEAAFETGLGKELQHFFLVPGLVPDARETFLRQRHLFLAYGSVTSVTYPNHDFNLAAIREGLRQRILSAARAGQKPVLVGVSVGGGIILDLLRHCRELGEPLPLGGLILVSPFTCTNDLAPLLRRLVDPILGEEPSDALEALEKGRSFFRMLASRSLIPSEAVGWRKSLALLTPSGLRAWQERAILRRIDSTLTNISPEGALARVCSLRELRGISDQRRSVICDAPTLILWGSKERQTLSMEGPGTGILCRPDLAYRLFPSLQIQWVYDAQGTEVPHGSLLKHAHAFNPYLKTFLRRLQNVSRAKRHSEVA